MVQWIKAALVASAAGALHAAGDQDLAARLQASLTALLAKVDPSAPQECLILVRPGFALTDDLLSGDGGFTTLVDQIPVPSTSYAASSALLSQTYSEILDKITVGDHVNQKDRNAARKAKEVLWDRLRPGQATKAYMAYLQQQDAFTAQQAQAALAADQAHKTGQGAAAADQALRTLQARIQAWRNLPATQAITQAQKTLDAFEAESLASEIQDMRAALPDDTGDPSGFAVVATPDPSTWLDDAGWQPWSMASTEGKTPPPGPKLPSKLASGAGGGDLVQVNLSLETKRVALTRPWLHESLFASRLWKLSDAGQDLMPVSSGNPADAKPGSLPMYITGLLLARKVVLTAKASGQAPDPATLLTVRTRPAKGSAQPTNTPTLSRTSDSVEIRADDPQIMGFFCRLVPKSPNPDPNTFYKIPPPKQKSGR